MGHAYSAIISHDMARRKGGKFYVRIEDLDQSRSKKKWENQIFEDLDWLGLSWDGPIVRQSEELEKYKNILTNFKNELGLFECFCSRKDIKLALSAPHIDDKFLGPDGLIYPGTCRENIVSSKINFKNVLRMKVDLDEEKIFTFNELGQKKGKISFTLSELSLIHI